MRNKVLILLVFLSVLAFASPQKDSVALENDYVKVMRHTSIEFLGDNSTYSTRILVALSDTKIECNRISKTLKRGEVSVYKSTEKYIVIDGDFFEVLIKVKHPEVKSPEKWIEPLKNKTVYENDQLRIFEERLEPSDTRELHSHAQRVVVRLNEVQLTDPRFHPNGTPSGGIQVPNTVKFAEPITHVVKNLSKIPLFNIIIEFKTQRI